MVAKKHYTFDVEGSAKLNSLNPVSPAKAGVQYAGVWIPACAGMTIAPLGAKHTVLHFPLTWKTISAEAVMTTHPAQQGLLIFLSF